MNISASDVKDAKLTATVTIPAADVDATIKKAYKAAAKQYRFPGFRPGKAPRPVIDSMLGSEAVLAQATNELIGSNEANVLNELDIVPVKEGNYENIDLCRDGEDYTYSVEFTLRPSVVLTSYDAVEIEMPPAEVTEAEIDSQVDMLMGYHATFEDVERAVEASDYITMDVENVKNAEAIAGEGRMFAMDSQSMPAEFTEAVLGMNVGDEKEISWTPEGAEEATIKVTLKSVKERKVPELTDEFVKESFSFDSIDAMRDAIKLEVEADKSSKLPALKENRVVAKLADVARESLALDALARELKLEVTDEDIDEEFKSAGVEDVEASKAAFVAEGRMPAVRDSIRRSKAVDWLVETAKVTEVDEYAERAAQ